MTQTVPLVLIAEDDLNSLYMMERFTRSSGCRALGTTSGENVLTLARQEKPNVILLDLMLPGISGWDVLQALRADPLTQPIPVIICTALNVADQALEANAGYLHKPVYYQVSGLRTSLTVLSRESLKTSLTVFEHYSISPS